MNKIVPFTKEIEFKTMISKITNISLEHTLHVEENNMISGYFIVDGKYKMTQASQIDEEFSYKIPVDIEIDQKYDTSQIILDIDDFKYEILDEDKLRLDINLSINNLEEKKLNDERGLDETLDNLFLEESPNIDLEIVPNDDENEDFIDPDSYDDYKEETTNDYMDNTINNDSTINNISNGMDSLFSSFKDSIETFKTYYVYVVKEEDSLDSILVKYKIDKESLLEYNDLNDVKPGNKIIIPSLKDE